jgi:hypothetical protein
MKDFKNKSPEDLTNDMSSIPAEDLLYLLQIAEENEQKYDSKQIERIYKRAKIALDFD